MRIFIASARPFDDEFCYAGGKCPDYLGAGSASLVVFLPLGDFHIRLLGKGAGLIPRSIMWSSAGLSINKRAVFVCVTHELDSARNLSLRCMGTFRKVNRRNCITIAFS